MIGGVLFGLTVCIGMYLIVGLGIGAIADTTRKRRHKIMLDEDEIDARFYGDHYGDEDY